MISVSDARRNLANHFRSIHVGLVGDADTAHLLPSSIALARWLAEYQEAYAHAVESRGAAAMHAMLGRSLTLEGRTILASKDDIIAIGEVAIRCGLSTTLALPVAALAAQGDVMQALRDALPGVRFRIDCSGLPDSPSADVLQGCRNTLTEHARRGGDISLVGDLATLRAMGLLDEPLFNQTFVTVHASPSGGVRHQQRRRAFSPCRDYIGWYIDAAGDVYPCAGLASHAPARFGSIHQPFAQLFDALSYSESSIGALANRGPHLDAGDAAAFPADLCALHRQRVHGIASL